MGKNFLYKNEENSKDDGLTKITLFYDIDQQESLPN